VQVPKLRSQDGRMGPASPRSSTAATCTSIPQHTLLFVILLTQLWSPYFSCTWDTLSGEKAEMPFKA